MMYSKFLNIGSAFNVCFNAIRGITRFFIAGSMLVMSNLAVAAYEYNLPEQVTHTGREITGLHNLIFFICLVILIVVSAAMFYSIFAHRKSKGVTPATFSHSTAVEIVWTVIPVLILIAMAIPATKLLIEMEDTTKSDFDYLISKVNIKVYIAVSDSQFV